MDRFNFEKGLATIRYLDISYRQPAYVDIQLGGSSAAGRWRRF
jgi:hypothetical protein